MELWLIFVLLHITTLIIIFLLDYNFLKDVFKNPEFPCIVSGLAFFPVILFGFYKGVDFSNIPILVLSFLIGIVAKLGSYGYFKSLDAGLSPGLIATIYKLQMVIAFIFGILIFNEELTSMQLLGHGLIFIGAIAFSLDHFHFKKNTIGLIFIFASMLSYSFANISVDYLYKFNDFYSVFTFVVLGYFLSSFIIIFGTSGGRNFFSDFFSNWKFYLGLGIFMEFFGVLEMVFGSLALKNGPLTLVIFLTQTYVIGIFLVSFIGGYFYPKIFPDSQQNSKLIKVGIIAFMLLGVYLSLV